MKSKKVNDLEIALIQIGKKFDLLIIKSLSKNRSGFNQILKNNPSLNPRTLSMRLKDLERNKIITKSLILGTPVKTEYKLTTKGKKVLPIIKQIEDWAK
jgi:DNA-binding HxlR family transcriptional regulator